MHGLRMLVGMLMVLTAGGAVGQTVAVSGSNRTIDVTATDRVISMADVGVVHIGFISYGATEKAAYAEGSRISNGIVAALVGAGVERDTIESENQAVAPVQSYEQQQTPADEKAQRKFQVTQSWTVRTRAEDAARALDVAIKAGANQSGQIDWQLRDEGTADAEAAGKALEHARANAAKMAGSLGAKLGALLYASNEVQAQPVRPMMRGMMMLKQDAAPAPLAVNPRRIERQATVHAIFALE